MSSVITFIFFAGVVVFLVWNSVSLVREIKNRKGRKKRESVKNLPNEQDKKDT